MPNNKQELLDIKILLNDIAFCLTQRELKEIKVSEVFYTYLKYFLKNNIIYEDNKNLPIGYVFGTPISIDKKLEGFE